jgi:hypothetical protein
VLGVALSAAASQAATINAAIGGTANQSSTGFGGLAGRANDGNTNGNYGANSVSHTNSTAVGNWWEVTLGPSTTGMELQNLTIFGRGDCCQNRSQNLTLQVFDASNNVLHTSNYVNPPGIPSVNGPQAFPAQGAQFVVPSGVFNAARVRVTSNFADYLSLAEVQVNVNNANIEVGGDNILGSTTLNGTNSGALDNARVVRIVQNKVGVPLSVTEVQAFQEGTGTNLALQGNGGVATQSTSSHAPSFLAGNGNDDAFNNFTHTNNTVAPGSEHWQVTLSANASLDRVRIYDRFDCCAGQLRNENIQLQIFSDTAATNMIFNQQILNMPELGLRDVLLGDETLVTLDPAGDYTFEIDGDTLASDVLSIAPVPGTQTHLVADGTLNVELLAGTIDWGDTFQLLSADIISGSFDQINLPRGGWDLSRLYIDGTITSTPEPASLALWLGLGLGLCAFGLRKKLRK